MSLGKLLDHGVGFVSQYMHLPCPSHPDTLDQLQSYYDLPLEVMFPAPPDDPQFEVSRAWPFMASRRQRLHGPSAHRCLNPDYAARHGRDYSQNDTLRARRIAPLRRKNKDLLIYVHGWMTPGAALEEVALMPWATRMFGADIVHLDLPFHGSRRPDGSAVNGSFFWSADLVRTIEAVRQAVMDIRTLMRWARRRGYRRVGLAGVSLGGVLTMLTACADDDLDFAVPIVAHTDLTAALQTAPILAAMRRDLTRANLSLEHVAELMARVGLGDHPLAMDKNKMLIVAAVDDVFLTPDAVLADWERWGRPPLHWIGGGHSMIFPNMVPVWLRIARFLKDGSALG